MLYLHCTTKIAKLSRTKLVPVPELSNTHWLDCWYVNIMQVSASNIIVLCTNAETLFSIIIQTPGNNVTLFAVVAEFRKRLESVLSGFGDHQQLLVNHNQYTACKTSSRSILGSMNDMVSICKYSWDDAVEAGKSITIQDLEHLINQAPMSVLKYDYPANRFRKLLLGVED
jgi:hypothetical protein